MDQYINKITLKRELVKDYSQYPFSVAAVKTLSSLSLKAPVTFFVGDNGTGKSTMIEAMAVSYGLNPEGGSKNIVFSTRNTVSQLEDYIVLEKGIKRPKDAFFLRAESFYNLASKIDDFGDLDQYYGGRSLHAQSHGESFLSTINGRFFGQGLYILDEPEAALSVTGQMAMLRLMQDLIKNHSQFIIATHSPILTAYPDAVIYEVTDAGISKKPYEEISNYELTKYFLNNYQKMLKEILD